MLKPADAVATPMRKAALVLLVVALAGCSGGAPDPVDDADFSDLDLTPTSTTGILRGVVVDEAIRPVAGAAVALRVDGGAERSTETSADGLFGFDGLVPGTYFLTTSKLGYTTSQASADVVAGIAEPPMVKLRLVLDPALTPYVTAFIWNGFIECSVRARDPVLNEEDPAIGGSGAGVNACSGQLNQNTEFPTPAFDETPALVQGELIWESTQSLGSGLSFVVGPPSCADVKWGRADGPSPQVIRLNQTTLDDEGDFEPQDGICYRVFSWVADEAQGAAGVVTSQKFDAYFHVFYNFLPPEGWQFSVDGQPVLPA